MSSAVFGLRAKTVITPTGTGEAVVLIDRNEGSIVSVVKPVAVPDGVDVKDLGDVVIMPGLVDSHVHINEPGRTEWEGFSTATRAAAAGGITTVADMPLNSHPVTTTLAAFKEKLEATAGQLWVDCAFFGGVVPGNTAALDPMIDAGVVGFKCFLIHSGIDEFPNVSESDLHAAMPVLARSGVPLLVHAELEQAPHKSHVHEQHDAAEHNKHGGGEPCVTAPGSPGDEHEPAAAWSDSRSYMQFLASRPRQWEDDAIALMIDLCRKHNCPVHIVHLSSADMVGSIRRAAVTEKLPFTVETCPHYLTFAAEEIQDGDTRFKCAPPIRERENREKLWAALRDETIGIVVSDHSPCTPHLKHLEHGDFKQAWGGISSLQFRLPAVWTEAQKRGFGFDALRKWLCEAPADFLGLGDRKGRIAAGYDADLVVWDPAADAVFSGDNIYHKHKVTPYEGRNLKGKVHETYLRGRLIWQNGCHIGTASGGTVLRKPVRVMS